MGSPDPSSASDLNATVQAVQELRTFPMDRAAVMQLRRGLAGLSGVWDVEL